MSIALAPYSGRKKEPASKKTSKKLLFVEFAMLFRLDI